MYALLTSKITSKLAVLVVLLSALLNTPAHASLTFTAVNAPSVTWNTPALYERIFHSGSIYAGPLTSGGARITTYCVIDFSDASQTPTHSYSFSVFLTDQAVAPSYSGASYTLSGYGIIYHSSIDSVVTAQMQSGDSWYRVYFYTIGTGYWTDNSGNGTCTPFEGAHTWSAQYGSGRFNALPLYP